MSLFFFRRPLRFLCSVSLWTVLTVVPMSVQAENLVRWGDGNVWGFNDDWGIASPGFSGEEAYRLARRAGMGWIRYTLYMYNVQRADGTIDWSGLDRVVDAAIRSGLEVALNLSWPSAYMTPYHPRAYRPWNCMRERPDGEVIYDPSLDPPNCDSGSYFDVGRFEAFVRAAVARYGDRVKHWGFGNENANGIFWRSGNAYEKVFIPGYDAAHAEARARGWSIQVFGPENDLVNVRDDGLEMDLHREKHIYKRKMWDIITFHHYSKNLDDFLLAAHPYRDFDGKREIWIGEAGVPSDDSSGSRQGQAMILAGKVDEYRQAIASDRMNRFFIYRLKGGRSEPGARADHGIIDEADAPKPAYDMIREKLCPAGSCLQASALFQLGDFTGDRFADFADFSRGWRLFWVHENYRNGAFAPPGVNYAIGSVDPGSAGKKQILLADATGDGVADRFEFDGSTHEVSVYRNDRNGNYSPYCTGRIPAGYQILVGDFNGDSKADIASRDLLTGEIMFYYQVQGPCTFSKQQTPAGRTMVGPGWRIFIGDFNGDGYADYADHHMESGYFWVHPNLRNGTFTAFGDNWAIGRTMPNLQNGEWTVLIGDFTGDGYADFADFHRPSGTFWVHENYRNGAFSPFGVNWGWGQAMPETEDWMILGKQ